MVRRSTTAPAVDPRPRVDEVRVGRNFIRVGDTVKVLPTKKGKRDGFIGTVTGIFTDDDGTVKYVEVNGDPRGFRNRALHLDRIERRQQKRSAA